jgi:hypothetical protein
MCGQHLGGSSRFRGPHLWGPHPAQGYHSKIPDHNHDPVPNSHLWCGAHLLLSQHLIGQSRAHTLVGEKKHKSSVASQVRDQKTVHNQWTRTIAIGFNTLQRLYNCTHSNRTGTGRQRFQALPYGWRPSKWIVPSCVSEPGSASVVELILPARGPSKLWYPYPASPGQSLLRREKPTPDTITPIRLQEGHYPLQVSPRTPAHNKAGGLYGKGHLKQGQLTIGP